MKYLEDYLNKVKSKNQSLGEAIAKTATDISEKYIKTFSYREHVVSLLLGEIQSGKTSHMFGTMCAAADEGFGIFLLLTTDSILLQQQTLVRAQNDLDNFFVCGEDDYLGFKKNNMRKPAVIVVKKNPRILKQWKNNLAATDFCKGNPLFIVDDEADAASLNTKVNKREQSTINKNLEGIKSTSSCSIYMQVTGTPQSILLQSRDSGWKPLFIYYFKPGNNYIGGRILFSGEKIPQIIMTDDGEANSILSDDDFPENDLISALVSHLITSAHLFRQGGKVCNFLVHPSVKTEEHVHFAEKIGQYLNEMNLCFDEKETKNVFIKEYTGLSDSCKNMEPFEVLYSDVIQFLRKDLVNILVLNSNSSYKDNTQYEQGLNIIVGGNSLGRGVTFPMLQTVYYCRVAKSPQADTMWQHARMFGYDRDFDSMRIYMPPKLYKLFVDINITNNSIINQIENSINGTDIKIFYPTGLRPTRKNVLDRKYVGLYSGGVNYFPFYPINISTESIDKQLAKFEDGEYTVSLKIINSLLGFVDSEIDDWNVKVFYGCINSLIADNPLAQGTMIVRRERDIAKGTGTLLSPNDRAIGEKIRDRVVLTMYKVTGRKGWNGEKIWIPNIKLPGDGMYYSGYIED